MATETEKKVTPKKTAPKKAEPVKATVVLDEGFANLNLRDAANAVVGSCKNGDVLTVTKKSAAKFNEETMAAVTVDGVDCFVMQRFLKF